mmetsp:Transcript_80271/g.239045  ORF Transcript_80271/g.239045 Transcript_80271/m.239045 type:complete len:278 (-) Transcript_80271:1475-2308(-)
MSTATSQWPKSGTSGPAPCSHPRRAEVLLCRTCRWQDLSPRAPRAPRCRQKWRPLVSWGAGLLAARSRRPRRQRPDRGRCQTATAAAAPRCGDSAGRRLPSTLHTVHGRRTASCIRSGPRRGRHPPRPSDPSAPPWPATRSSSRPGARRAPPSLQGCLRRGTRTAGRSPGACRKAASRRAAARAAEKATARAARAASTSPPCRRSNTRSRPTASPRSRSGATPRGAWRLQPSSSRSETACPSRCLPTPSRGPTGCSGPDRSAPTGPCAWCPPQSPQW